MKATCAWCQDLAARKADEDLTDMVAKAVIEVARLTEELAQAEVAANEAREATDLWKSEAEECSKSFAYWFREANDQVKLREQAEQERDEARAELERLHRLAPIGQYTMSAPHEHEIVRLGAALSGAEQERDEARAEVRTLKASLSRAELGISAGKKLLGEKLNELARAKEDLAKASVLAHEARTDAEWAKERLVEAREECDRQRALVARLAEAAELADVWDPDALVQGVDRMRKAMKGNDVVCQSMSPAKESP